MCIFPRHFESCFVNSVVSPNTILTYIRRLKILPTLDPKSKKLQSSEWKPSNEAALARTPGPPGPAYPGKRPRGERQPERASDHETSHKSIKNALHNAGYAKLRSSQAAPDAAPACSALLYSLLQGPIMLQSVIFVSDFRTRAGNQVTTYCRHANK